MFLDHGQGVRVGERNRVCLVTSKAGSESCEGRQSMMLYAAANQMHIFSVYREAHAKTKTPNNIFIFIQHLYSLFNWVSWEVMMVKLQEIWKFETKLAHTKMHDPNPNRIALFTLPLSCIHTSLLMVTFKSLIIVLLKQWL